MWIIIENYLSWKLHTVYISFVIFSPAIDSKLVDTILSPFILSQVVHEFYAIKLFNTNSIMRLERWPSRVLRIRA